MIYSSDDANMKALGCQSNGVREGAGRPTQWFVHLEGAQSANQLVLRAKMRS